MTTLVSKAVELKSLAMADCRRDQSKDFKLMVMLASKCCVSGFWVCFVF